MTLHQPPADDGRAIRPEVLFTVAAVTVTAPTRMRRASTSSGTCTRSSTPRRSAWCSSAVATTAPGATLLGGILRPWQHLDHPYPIGYTPLMIEVRQTATFVRWFKGLRDSQARARILVRIRRLSLGNPGDVRDVGAGVSELRIPWGPGYRVYFVARGEAAVVLLAGGDKRTQARDIQEAIELARML